MRVVGGGGGVLLQQRDAIPDEQRDEHLELVRVARERHAARPLRHGPDDEPRHVRIAHRGLAHGAQEARLLGALVR